VRDNTHETMKERRRPNDSVLSTATPPGGERQPDSVWTSYTSTAYTGLIHTTRKHRNFMAHRKRIDWKGRRIDNTATQRRCSSPASLALMEQPWGTIDTQKAARLLNQSQHKAMFAVDAPNRQTRDE